MTSWQGPLGPGFIDWSTKKAALQSAEIRGTDIGRPFSRTLRTSTDSATTERAPPEPESRATVATKCRHTTARSRTAGCYQDRDTGKECSRILEFAMHRPHAPLL